MNRTPKIEVFCTHPLPKSQLRKSGLSSPFPAPQTTLHQVFAQSWKSSWNFPGLYLVRLTKTATALHVLQVNEQRMRFSKTGKTELSTTTAEPKFWPIPRGLWKICVSCVFQDLGIYSRLGDPELDFALGLWWHIVLRSLQQDLSKRQEIWRAYFLPNPMLQSCSLTNQGVTNVHLSNVHFVVRDISALLDPS